MSEQIDVDRVLADLKAIVSAAANEEEVKINAERVLHDEVLSKLGLQPGRYEYTFVSGGRPDALYGHLVIEYKAPGKLSQPSDIARAKEQLVRYILKEAVGEVRYKLFLGVILSDRIAFVRYDPKLRDWPLRGPYDLNRESVLRLIEAIRGLRRKKLAVDELLRDFGPASPLTKRIVGMFYNKLTGSRSPKVKALFNDWKRVFSQICAYSPEKLRGLEVEYGMGGSVAYTGLLFSVHTHYALLMKLLGAEVAYLYGTGKFLKSYVAELEDAHMRGLDSLKRALDELESGGVFRRLLNITNFVEGDYFSWYLEELDGQVAAAISEMAKKLADYEPATPVLEPEYTRDLLKRLYQNLVPKKIRHDLGEYYTPDWLADLVLNEVGITVENLEKLARGKNDTLAPLNLRVLDPACGSGTFLVLTMKRSREYAEEHYLRDVLSNYLLRNFVGFDLNPLAVLAARTNYLLATADLLPYVKGSIEIPIYLADSLLVETRTTLTGPTYVIRTYVGQFEMPKSLVARGLQGRLLEAVDRYVRQRYSANEFSQRVKSELNLDENELKLVGDLYKTFLKLEEEGKNHVWTSIIRNAFAPLTIVGSYGKFDYVIGNPPWVNWESLPENYRGISAVLWDKYHLKVSPTAQQVGLGKRGRDLSMLFVYVCSDRYLADNGWLGFLITQMVFKTGGVAGFRRFTLPSGETLGVVTVHDMVSLKPFEAASNMTSVIILEKGKQTTYPVPYVRWIKQRRGEMGDISLNEALSACSQDKLVAVPVDDKDKNSAWLTEKPPVINALNKVKGISPYKAHAGVYTGGTNGVYWTKILEKTSPNLVTIENLYSVGKKELKRVMSPVEVDLLHRLLRSGDVGRWKWKSESYVIVPHTPVTSWRAIHESEMKSKFPQTYSYFAEFRDVLLKRPDYVLRRKRYPFYIMFNAHRISFMPYKVAWRRIASRMEAVVLGPLDDINIGRKVPVFQETLSYIPSQDENEAHFLCAILNSFEVDLLVRSFSQLGGKSFATPSVLEQIRIPKYDPMNEAHRKLAELSRKAHQLTLEATEEELAKVENEINELVGQLYGLTDEELEEIEKSLAILGGKWVEEVEEAEELPALEPDVALRNNIVEAGKPFDLEVVVGNPLEEAIRDVKVKAELPGRGVERVFQEVKGEEVIQVRLDELSEGQYKVKLVMDYNLEGVNRRLEKELSIFIKGGPTRVSVDRGEAEKLFGGG